MPVYDGPTLLRVADQAVIRGFWDALTETKADGRLELALVAAGIVEANLQNPAHGDKDSVGSLQQRDSWGPRADRMDPRKAALAFLADATRRVLPRTPDVAAGVLAQLVQRSAFPDRYTQALPAAAHVIARTRPGGGHMARTTFDGYTVDARTAAQLKEAERLFGRKIEVTQGSYSNGGLSAGTHLGGGVVDISTRQMGLTGAEITRLVKVLRTVGLWAWYRTRPEWSGAPHIHAVSVGCRDLHSSAAAQIASARRGRNGLAGNGTDRHAALGLPVVSWEQYLEDRGEQQKPTDEHRPGSRTIQQGDKGTDVAVMQRVIGATPDGDFGPLTAAALKKWQASKTLLADGICGPVTWKKILAELASPKPSPVVDGIYPGATVKLLPTTGEPRIQPIGVILHVDAGNNEDLFEWFRAGSGGVESHFQITTRGVVYQYRAAGYEADANLKANSFVEGGVRKGYLSVETQGLMDGEWSAAQIEAIKGILTWAHKAYRIPLEICTGPRDPGIGWHVMFGAPGPWTPSVKACPGPKRIEQIKTVLEPWMRSGGKVDPGPEPDDGRWQPRVDAKPGAREVGPGSVGSDVGWVQRALDVPPPAPDDHYGPLTEAAVEKFQGAHRLPATGRVDVAVTWPALIAAEAEQDDTEGVPA